MDFNQIILDDPDIIQFFKENDLLDRNRFISHLIKKYKADESCVKDVSSKIELSKDEIYTLYREHKDFLDHKKTLLNLTREFHRNVQSTINSLKFKEINEFYTTHLNLENNNTFVCDICNVFNVTTKKGLATHQRKCRKNIMDDSSSIE
jgi:hypothetical protein